MRVEMHPQMSGPIQATVTIFLEEMDSGVFDLLKKRMKGGGGLQSIKKSNVTVILHDNPE
jgi:hypothetical protein